MRSEELTQRIKKLAFPKGADLFGVASVDRFQGGPEGHHPLDLFSDCQSVIALGRRFLMGMIDSLDPARQQLCLQASYVCSCKWAQFSDRL